MPRNRSVCANSRSLRIPYHNKADGFMAALVLTLNQVKFCELHSCQPNVQWGAFPACKYRGVRFPGRTPFYDGTQGTNAFEYFFRPICAHLAPALTSPTLSCEQRERVHRQLPWAVRTYYYGLGDPISSNGTEAYLEDWFGASRHFRTYASCPLSCKTEWQVCYSSSRGASARAFLSPTSATVPCLRAPNPGPP